MMPFNFTLTISGLCVIVLKSQDDKPTKPTAVDILCVGAYYHRPRLSYAPDHVDLQSDYEPELCIDPQANRIASLDVGNAELKLDLASGPPDFALEWESVATVKPATTADERYMDWVPSVGDLDLTGIRVKGLDYGINARLSLPPGTISAHNVIKDQVGTDYATWDFLSDERALANEVVYTAQNVASLTMTWGKNNRLEYIRAEDFLMCLSNDMERVPSDYSSAVTMLHHMVHLQNLADPLKSVRIPTLHTTVKTGRPICNQVYFVDKS